MKSDQSDQSNQSWSSVCDKDFDQQDAEVVCRELGCGAPSFLQGALYGDGKTPMWTKEFRCGGNESALLGCGSSAGSTCSPGNAVGLTCSGRGAAVGFWLNLILSQPLPLLFNNVRLSEQNLMKSDWLTDPTAVLVDLR